MTECRSLILYEHQVDLAKLYEFSNLKDQMLKARSRFFKLYDSSLELSSKFLSDLPETKIILQLRRDIRMATRGTPATTAQDAVQVGGYVSTQTEMLYNAEQHLVKIAWRAVAPLVHPDRSGGSTEMFQTALSAYRLRDLTYLQDLYIQLQKDNVFWRCSKESRTYLDTEIQRPEVSLQRLRNKPEFQIVMLARTGKPDAARAFAQDFAQRLVSMLKAELHFLLTGEVYKPDEDVQDGTEESGNGEGQNESESGDRNDQDCGPNWSGQ